MRAINEALLKGNVNSKKGKLLTHTHAYIYVYVKENFIFFIFYILNTAEMGILKFSKC